MKTIAEKDKEHCWHPFTQHLSEQSPIVISSAKGSYFFDDKNKKYIDFISSWWTCLHGHAHPALGAALTKQAGIMSHVMFAGFTHQPAADLSAALADILPGDLNRVFFSDNGSTAVEVSMKLAFQYWHNRFEQARPKYICFEGAYHGDTFGAMAVGKGSGYFNLYQDLLCEVLTIPFPETWEGDLEVVSKEEQSLTALTYILENASSEISALLVEPLMQGAGGMRFCRPEYLEKVVDKVREFNILVIFDEVATGFGRTGKMFAMEHTKIIPDIVCLSKGLTGGYMPLSVTISQDYIFEAFLGDNFSSALPHGHSYTANPLGCAIALRSLALFSEEKTLERVQRINKKHQNFIPILSQNILIDRVRVLGTILAFNLKGGEGQYKSNDSLWLRDWFLERGFNIRPLGDVVYLFPPFSINDDDLEIGYLAILEGLQALSLKNKQTS